MYQSPRHRVKLAIIVIAALTLMALSLFSRHSNLLPAAVTANQPGLYRVAHVIDGDTIDVENNGHPDRVRYLGMDTPETKDPRKPVQCFGEAAADKNRQLVEGREVRLEADPIDSDRDKYHRLLRYVYLPDGTFVNEVLVQQGYAFAYTVFPLTKLGQFEQWEGEAKAASIGLWHSCNVDESQAIKQTTTPKAG